MENETLKRINDFLARHDASVDTISKSRLEQLTKIDEAIQKRIVKRKDAQKTLKTTPINISTIAEDTNIARKTFYNNELLRLYVDEYSASIEKNNASEEELKRLKEQNEDLSAQVKKFTLRDVETEDLRQEVINLQKEIVNLRKRNESLEKQYAEIKAALEENEEEHAKDALSVKLSDVKLN